MAKYIISFSFLLTVWSTAYTDTHTGIVLRVFDGNTFTLLTDTKKRLIIRLAYIDTPELDQSFGFASKDKLNLFLNGEKVTLKTHTID